MKVTKINDGSPQGTLKSCYKCDGGAYNSHLYFEAGGKVRG